jgi:hypothetical protein
MYYLKQSYKMACFKITVSKHLQSNMFQIYLQNKTSYLLLSTQARNKAFQNFCFKYDYRLPLKILELEPEGTRRR